MYLVLVNKLMVEITAANGNDKVFGVNGVDNIYCCQKPCSQGNWKRISGSLIQVDAMLNTLCGLNRLHQIYSMNSYLKKR